MSKVAVSNIAWPQEKDDNCLAQLQKLAIQFVELAPTKIFGSLDLVSTKELADYNTKLKSFDLLARSFQSVFFGKPELQLFGSTDTQKKFANHFVKFFDAMTEFGGEVVVFGSPKNRLRGNLNLEDATKIASEIFYEIGDEAKKRKIVVGIEANSKFYGCDFLNTTQEAYEFVEKVDHPSIRLHLDIGNMELENENVVENIRDYLTIACHLHISAPKLKAPLLSKQVAEEIRKSNYSGIHSIEMIIDPFDQLQFEKTINLIAGSL